MRELIDPPDVGADAPVDQREVVGVVSNWVRINGTLRYLDVRLEDGTDVKARARGWRKVRMGERVLVSRTSLGPSVSYRVVKFLEEEPASDE
jgi:transcription elongation GreA/GreB family factor